MAFFISECNGMPYDKPVNVVIQVEIGQEGGLIGSDANVFIFPER